MRKFFYFRLALGNIKKNSGIYRPYLLAVALIIALFYSLGSISVMVLTSGAEGSGTMGYLLSLSTYICGIVSLAILFYINSFIMKHRKSEFGLYSILGMEKRHIARVMACEVFIAGASGMVCGVAGGALFSQLLFLLLLRIVSLPVALTFQIPFSALASTAILFGVGFAIVLAYDVIGVLRGNPVDLLRSTKEGEREPKARRLAAAIGMAALLGGYSLALTVQKPSDVVTVFLLTVLLVIIGTYLLFMTGSIVLLKLLRKNNTFYYHPKNFISVSGMLYRMKQNAAGLANICILSTCVLVTLSSTVSLFIGEENILRQRYPRQVQNSCIATDEQSGLLLRQAAESHAAKYGMAIQDAIGYLSFTFPARQTADNAFFAADLYTGKTRGITVLLLDEYNHLTGSAHALREGEALISPFGEPIGGDTIALCGQEYKIAGTVPPPDLINMDWQDGIAVILPAYSDLERLQNQYGIQEGVATRVLQYRYDYDVSGSPDKLAEYIGTMREDLLQTVEHLSIVRNIDSARDEFYQLYGSLMFVGLFFVALFLIAAVLIIYYKQITEGFDDHARFQILQDVGMSDKEVRATISKQVLTVFFLPIGMAILHISVAFPVLCKLLTLFGMYDRGLFLACTASAVLAFALLYLLVYRLTARAYYRIVRSVR